MSQHEMAEMLLRQDEMLSRYSDTTKLRHHQTLVEGGLRVASHRDRKNNDRVLSQHDWYIRHIEGEKRRLAHINQEIREVTKKADLIRENSGGLGSLELQARTMARSMQALQNRLGVSLQKLNMTRGRNRELREDVTARHNDRSIFDAIYRKLEVEIHTKHHELRQLQKKQKTAFAARDGAHGQLLDLLDGSADGEDGFVDKLFGVQTDPERIRRKARKRERQRLLKPDDVAAAEMEALQRLKAKIKLGAFHFDDEDEDDDGAPPTDVDGRPSSPMSAMGNPVVSSWRDLSMDRVEEYEAAFLRIQDATGVENIDELIKQFIDSENKSYELFQLVNQRTEEADVKQAQVRALQDEVAKVKGVDASSAAGDRRKRLDQAYALQRLHKVLEDKACKHDEVTKSLRQIYEPLEHLFHMLCAGDQMKSYVGPPGSLVVNDTNGMRILAVIEQRAQELLQMHQVLVVDDRLYSSGVVATEEAVDAYVRQLADEDPTRAGAMTPNNRTTNFTMSRPGSPISSSSSTGFGMPEPPLPESFAHRLESRRFQKLILGQGPKSMTEAEDKTGKVSNIVHTSLDAMLQEVEVDSRGRSVQEAGADDGQPSRPLRLRTVQDQMRFYVKKALDKSEEMNDMIPSAQGH